MHIFITQPQRVNCKVCISSWTNKLGLTQKKWLPFSRRHFQMHFLEKKNVWISIKFSLKFVSKGPINNIPALVQIMACRQPGNLSHHSTLFYMHDHDFSNMLVALFLRYSYTSREDAVETHWTHHAHCWHAVDGQWQPFTCHKHAISVPWLRGQSLNQCWLIVFWFKFHCIHENAIDISEKAAILSSWRWVNGVHVPFQSYPI